jgi:hypothetical protein
MKLLNINTKIIRFILISSICYQLNAKFKANQLH